MGNMLSRDKRGRAAEGGMNEPAARANEVRRGARERAFVVLASVFGRWGAQGGKGD